MLVALINAVFGVSLAMASNPSELSLRWAYSPAVEPLTTEKAWAIDPDEPNPHRVRWLLDRNVKIVDLKSQESNGYRLKLGSIEAQTQLFMRKKGPYFSEMGQFPCSKKPDDRFATYSESLKAANWAAEEWKKVLERSRDELSVNLRRLSAPSAEISFRLAEVVFRQWLKKRDEEWRKILTKDTRAREWKKYREVAKKEKICPRKTEAELPNWTDVVYSDSNAAQESKLLVRVPAKRTQGAFVIRVSVDIAGKRLNGRFLIDSSIEENLISPRWLQAQGVFPFMVELPSPVTIQRKWNGRQRDLKLSLFDGIEISSMPVAIREFWLTDTEIMFPPDSVNACCDGVLGRSFMRKFAVEWVPHVPTHIKLWSRGGYRGFKNSIPIEVSTNSKSNDIRSNCRIEKQKRKPSRRTVLWSTASSGAAILPERDRPTGKGVDRSLVCDGKEVVSSLKPVAYSSRVRSTVNIGMAVLARDKFVLDLAHGFIWIPKGVHEKPVPSNRSGLNVVYQFEDGARVLRIQSIAPRSPATPLVKQGLRPGVKLLQLNGQSVEEMDDWAVNHVLSGFLGSRLTLTWSKGKDVKVAPLQLNAP